MKDPGIRPQPVMNQEYIDKFDDFRRESTKLTSNAAHAVMRIFQIEERAQGYAKSLSGS